MRIIISPAKQMRLDTDSFVCTELPVFTDRAEILKDWIRSLSYEEQKTLWACNDKIARQNAERFAHMDLTKNLTPALLAYDGIQYTYMAPAVFEDGQFDYVQEHLRILSGFYGVVKPLDGVVPYRLEMQAKAAVDGHRNLYDFWGDSLYREVMDDSRILINLASKEYAKCIEKYLRPDDRYITCVFGEPTGGRVVQKGVYAKAASSRKAFTPRWPEVKWSGSWPAFMRRSRSRSKNSTGAGIDSTKAVLPLKNMSLSGQKFPGSPLGGENI